MRVKRVCQWLHPFQLRLNAEIWHMCHIFCDKRFPKLKIWLILGHSGGHLGVKNVTNDLSSQECSFCTGNLFIRKTWLVYFGDTFGVKRGQQGSKIAYLHRKGYQKLKSFRLKLGGWIHFHSILIFKIFRGWVGVWGCGGCVWPIQGQMRSNIAFLFLLENCPSP